MATAAQAKKVQKALDRLNSTRSCTGAVSALVDASILLGAFQKSSTRVPKFSRKALQVAEKRVRGVCSARVGVEKALKARGKTRSSGRPPANVGWNGNGYAKGFEQNFKVWKRTGYEKYDITLDELFGSGKYLSRTIPGFRDEVFYLRGKSPTSKG